MDTMKLFNELEKLWWKLDSAKSLVDDGKEVLCSNRLQGAMVNLKLMLDELGKEIKNKNELDK